MPKEEPNDDNVCDARAFTINARIIELKPTMSRPAGTAFLGAKPTTVKARIGDVRALSVPVVIDSGSDITLISESVYKQIDPLPPLRKGLDIKMLQVVDDSKLDTYVEVPLYIECDETLICIRVEAYIVTSMNAPMLLGNDFSDQYRISIVRDEKGTHLSFLSEKKTVECEDSVIPSESSLAVKALMAGASISAKPRNTRVREEKPISNVVRALKDEWIPANTIKKIRVNLPWRKHQKEGFISSNREIRHPLKVSDVLVEKGQNFMSIQNHTDSPIKLFRGDELGTFHEPNEFLDERDDIESDYKREVESLTHLTRSTFESLKRPEEVTEPVESAHAEATPDLGCGPKTAETPDPDPVPSSNLLKEINFNPDLSESRRKALEEVVLRHEKAFGLDGRLGHYPAKVEVNLQPNAKPVSLPPYAASPEKRIIIDKQLEKWLSLGVIQKSKSPWGAPVIIVFQKGKARFCVDFRRLNDVTISDEYPLPKQSDILQALSGAQWLSSFDALSGFTQLEIVPEHRERTAFRTHRGLYEFVRLPFGMRNGPSYFQRVMNDVLSDMLWLFVLVYIDDIICYSKTFDEHVDHIDRILAAIEGAGLTLSPSKCHLGYQSLLLLGQKVSRLGISTHKEKVDAICAIKAPSKVHELQIFMGMVNYFSNYIPYYTWISKPLFSLLKKEEKWKWGEVENEAFELCKLGLRSAPVLAYAQPGKGYRLYTDACDFGIGAVLQQVQAVKIRDLEGTKIYDRLKSLYDQKLPPPSLVTPVQCKEETLPVTTSWDKVFEETEIYIERVIGYWSRLLKAAEKKYSPTEKEALGLRDGLVKFQALLEGELIVAITDHSALTWSKTYQNLNRRLMTWGLTFSAYARLYIIHRAGRVHSNVDPLSRLRRRIPFFEAPPDGSAPYVDLEEAREGNDTDTKIGSKFQDLTWNLVASLAKKKKIVKPHTKRTKEVPYRRANGDTVQVNYALGGNESNLLISIDSKEKERFIQEYQNDPFFKGVIEELKEEIDVTAKSYKPRHTQYRLDKEGFVLFDDHSNRHRLCVPVNMRKGLLEEMHSLITEGAHPGFERMYARLALHFYWPGMGADAKRLVSSCDTCQKIKPRRHAPYGLLKPIPIPSRPFEVVSMDLIIDLPVSDGFDSVFVIVCKLTKFAFFIPCHKDIDEVRTAKLFFDNVVCFAGLPSQIISDRDARWQFEFWKEVCIQMGSKRALTTSYHPQADGQTEILNQYLEIAMRGYVNATKSNWAQMLPKLCFSYNTTPHTATKYAPAWLLFGFHPRRPVTYLIGEDGESIDRPVEPDYQSGNARAFVEEFEGARSLARDSLRVAQTVYERNYNKNHLNVSYNVGDLVLINPHTLKLGDFVKGHGVKLNAKYDGPFEIQERVSAVAYRIRLPQSYGIHNVISIAHLEPYNSAKEIAEIEDLPDPARLGFADIKEDEVEEIVAQKMVSAGRGKRNIIYYCRWKEHGITDRHVTARGMRNAPEVLDQWKKDIRLNPSLLNRKVVGNHIVDFPSRSTPNRAKLSAQLLDNAPPRRNPRRGVEKQ